MVPSISPISLSRLFCIKIPFSSFRERAKNSCILMHINRLSQLCSINLPNMPGHELQQKNRPGFRWESLLQEEACCWKTVSQSGSKHSWYVCWIRVTHHFTPSQPRPALQPLLGQGVPRDLRPGSCGCNLTPIGFCPMSSLMQDAVCLGQTGTNALQPRSNAMGPPR